MILLLCLHLVIKKKQKKVCIQWNKVPRTSVKTRCQILLICGLKGPDQPLTSAKATSQLGLDAAVKLQQGALGMLGRSV